MLFRSPQCGVVPNNGLSEIQVFSSDGSSNTPPPASAASDDCLVGKWQFDELTPTPSGSGTPTPTPAPILDSSGAALNGTLTGGARIPNGISGSAISLSSGSSYVTIPNNVLLQATNGLTVSAWVYPTQQNNGAVYTIVIKGGATIDFALRVNSSGYIEFTVPDLTPAAVSGPKLPLNTWSMVTGEYDQANQQLKIYVNEIGRAHV